MADFHVNYNTGSDTTGNGSAANPWGTVLYALTESAAGTGDTIKVANGATYSTVGTMVPTSNNSPNQFTTTADYTSSLSVNDVIMVNPNISGAPEFDGWMKMKITAIDATTITVQQRMSIPNQIGLTMDILKASEYVDCGSSGNFETWTENLGVGAIVEFGYNDTFTSVVGKTIFKRTGLASNSRTGTAFKMTTPFSPGLYSSIMPYMKNVEFQNFAKGIEVGFGQSSYSQNLAFFNCGMEAGTYAMYIADGSEQHTNIEISDCTGTLRPINSLNYMLSGDDPAETGAYSYNIKSYMGSNSWSIGVLPVNDLTGHTSAYINQPFGIAPILYSCVSNNIIGDVCIILNDETQATSQYGRTTCIATGSNMNIKPTSLKLVDNGGNGYFSLYSHGGGISIQQTHGYVELPASTPLADLKIVGQNDGFPGVLYSLKDNATGENWTNVGGYLQTVNTTEQETGDSCIQFGQIYNTYAQYAKGGQFAFEKVKGGLTATSIDVRMKAVVASVNFKAYIQGIDGLLFLSNLGAPVGPYVTRTINLTGLVGDDKIFGWDNKQAIALSIYPDLQNNWQAGEYGFIDSVTVNYA